MRPRGLTSSSHTPVTSCTSSSQAAAGSCVKTGALNSRPETRSSPPPARSIALKISLTIFWSGSSSTVLKGVSVANSLHPERSEGPLFPRLLFWSTIRRTRGTKKLLLALAFLLFVYLAIPAQSSPQPSQAAFSDRTAATLLRQLSQSLEGHSKKNFLALFDLEKMKDGPLFKQQIDSFFAQADTIAVHFNLAGINADAETPTFAVDAEMEVQPRIGGQASRVSNRVTFTVGRGTSDWKIVGVQPRSFFSLP